MNQHVKLANSNNSSNFIMDLFFKIDRMYWKLYLYLLMIGILCHGFMFFNKIPNHDDAVAISSKGTTVILGRWFLDLTSVFSGAFSIPLFIGIFSLTMIIFSAFLVCKVLDIEAPKRIFAVGALMICFPAVAGTFAFMFTSDSYFFALFLSCAGIWFSVKLPIKIKMFGEGTNYIISIILFALTLGLYQAYFSVAVTLSIAYGMLLFLRNPLNRFFKEFLKLLIVLALGMLLYLIINYLVLTYTNNRFVETSVSDVIVTAPHAFIMSYKNLFSLFSKDLAGLSYGKLIQLSWIMSAVAIVWIFVWLSVKRRKHILIVATFLLMIPISINFMRFFMNAREMDALIMYAYVVFFIIPISLLGEYEKCVEDMLIYSFKLKMLRTIYVLIIFSLVWQYTIQSNRFYLGMYLMKSEAISYYTTMITQIKSVSGYTSDLPVCLIGTNSQDQSLSKFNPFTADIRGKLSLNDFISMYSRQSFIAIYCGYSPTWYQEIDEMNELPEVQKMPCYPDDGSIKILNHIIVVKLEEVPVQ